MLTLAVTKKAAHIWTALLPTSPAAGIVAKAALRGAGRLCWDILPRSAVDMRGQFFAQGFCKHGRHAISLEFLKSQQANAHLAAGNGIAF